jgi:hypothetical protein
MVTFSFYLLIWSCEFVAQSDRLMCLRCSGHLSCTVQHKLDAPGSVHDHSCRWSINRTHSHHAVGRRQGQIRRQQGPRVRQSYRNYRKYQVHPQPCYSLSGIHFLQEVWRTQMSTCTAQKQTNTVKIIKMNPINFASCHYLREVSCGRQGKAKFAAIRMTGRKDIFFLSSFPALESITPHHVCCCW